MLISEPNPCDHIPVDLPHPDLLSSLYVPYPCGLISGPTSEDSIPRSNSSDTHSVPVIVFLLLYRSGPRFITSQVVKLDGWVSRAGEKKGVLLVFEVWYTKVKVLWVWF